MSRNPMQPRSHAALWLAIAMLFLVGAIAAYTAVAGDPSRASSSIAGSIAGPERVAAASIDAVPRTVPLLGATVSRSKTTGSTRSPSTDAPTDRLKPIAAPFPPTPDPSLAVPVPSPAILRLKTALAEMSARAPTDEAVATAAPAVSAPESAWALEYSAADPGVVPPIPLGAQLPAGPAEQRQGARTRVEFLVLSDGNVSWARLLDPPRNAHEVMLLSAVKAWKFIPAQKDGHPVCYRKTITVFP
jgi:TonB family protein